MSETKTLTELAKYLTNQLRIVESDHKPQHVHLVCLKVLEEVVLAEREACAEFCDAEAAMATQWINGKHTVSVCRALAAKIRARSEAK